MGANKSRPHVLVLPEDKANLQVANGFHLEVPWNRQRQMQVLREAGGWNQVIELFESVHATEMHRNDNRFMVLLIDLDGRPERLANARARIPENLNQRVFILGAWTEPEALRPELGTYEAIGAAMARSCREGADGIWQHHLLHHNMHEVERLLERVRPILFPPN